LETIEEIQTEITRFPFISVHLAHLFDFLWRFLSYLHFCLLPSLVEAEVEVFFFMFT